MNNNTIIINNYLQNKMSASERAAFEAQLTTDKELQNELQVQQQIIKAAEYSGLKMEFAKAIRKQIIVKRITRWGTLVAASVLIIVVLYNFRQNTFFNKIPAAQQDLAGTQQAIGSQQPFINPPLQAINVPFSEYSFDAAKGDMIFHASGSVIYFPPLALIDAAGNAIKGTVTVRYREFMDPIDFFVSGIPMQYDSAGKKYNFESSGMCEINAYKDNKAVFVNPKAKPQINLSSKNKSPLHNVYFLDTITRSWKYDGKDIITEVKNAVRPKAGTNHATAFENEYLPLPAKPLKPMKADGDRQAFSIEIDSGSFEELFAYDHLKFEVTDESSYKRSDAEEHWNNVKLERSNTEGVYTITFTNAARKVSYRVRPVLEGADYAAALKVFNEKNMAYEAALKNRVVQDKKKSDSIILKNKQLQEKWNADNEKNNKINALITARNKVLREKRQREIEELQKNQPQYVKDHIMTDEIIRTFSVNNFGVWNCDRPQYSNEMPLYVSFTDSLNNKIDLYSIAVVYKGFNGIVHFTSTRQIRVIPGTENMIWSITNGIFYYLTYKDFMATGISRDSKSFTFRMRRSMKKISSYNEIRELVENL